MRTIAEAPELVSRISKARRKPVGGDIAASRNVQPGERNTWLTSYAGRLRRHGASESTLQTKLLKLNETFPESLSEPEVDGIARSVSRYPTLPDLSERGVSEIFAREFEGKFRFTPTRGWLFYDDTVWHRDSGSLYVQEAAKELVQGIRERVDDDPTLSPSDREMLGKQARALQRSAPITNIVRLARSSPRLVDTDDWVEQPELLNFANGTLDLRTMELKQHDPSDRLMKVLAYEYDPKAEAPNFQRVLHDALGEERSNFLLRLYGYALGGTGVEQKMAILLGNGRNGKSTIAEAISRAMGAYATTANPETFIKLQNRSTINNDVAALCGSRLVTTSELTSEQRLDSALVKRMTGGDKLKARFLHQEFFEFELKALIVMVSNFPPLLDGSDFGIVRRLLFIPFDNTLSDHKVDPTLPTKLESERAGIMNLLLQGYLDYRQRNGLDIPDDIRGRTDEVVKDHNQVLRFVEDQCLLEPSARTKASELFGRYQMWCFEEQVKPMSGRFFKGAVERSLSISQTRTSSGLFWQGVRLK